MAVIVTWKEYEDNGEPSGDTHLDEPEGLVTIKYVNVGERDGAGDVTITIGYVEFIDHRIE